MPRFQFAVLFFVLASSVHAQPSASLESRFAANEAGQWQLRRLGVKPSLEFGESGLRFTSEGLDMLSREVAVDNQPFEMLAEVEITSGEIETWRNKGVHIALSSAPADKMGKDDWGVLFGAVSQGAIATAKKGGLRAGVEVRPGVWNLSGSDIAPRFTLSMAGGGGHDYSVPWPAELAGTKLRFHAWRDDKNTLRFAIFHPDGAAGPWWEGQATIPAELQKKPLRFLNVLTGREASEFKAPSPTGTRPVEGVLSRLSVRPLAGEKPTLNQPFPAAVLAPPAMWQPRSLLTPARLQELREKFNAPHFAGYKTVLLRQATPEALAKTDYGTPAQNEGLMAALFAYVLTGDKATYWAPLLEQIDAQIGPTDKMPSQVWGFPGQLRQQLDIREFMGHNVAALALAYDLAGSELDAARRDRMRFLLVRALKFYRSKIKTNDWWYANNPSNTIGVGSGLNGLIAVTLLREQPELSKAVIESAIATVNKRFVGVENDGGSLEGPMYWQYGLNWPLLFGWALREASGDDRKLLNNPKIQNAPAYVAVNLGGDGKMVPFNDTQPWLIGWPVLAAASREFDSPLARWMADFMAGTYAEGATSPEQTRPSYAIPALLYRDRIAAPANFPGLPNVAHLSSNQEAILRSDGAQLRPALVTAIKGNGARNTHHANHDQGSFVLYADGEMLLLDPGYFEPEANKHSLPLLGDNPNFALNNTAPAPISELWESGALRSATVDAGAAYNTIKGQPKLVTRARRVFVQIGDKALIVLDDYLPLANTPLVTQFQAGVPATANGSRATLRGAKNEVTLQCFGPNIALKVAPREWAKDWVYKRAGVQWSTISGRYNAEADKPLVTVFTRAPHGAAPTASVDYGATIRVQAGGASVEFRQSEQGWAVVKP